MGKRIYGVLVVLIALVGLSLMLYFGAQPRPIPKSPIARFENHQALVDSLLVTLREDIKRSPVLFLGLDPEQAEHGKIWREFLNRNQEAGFKYDLVVIEQGIVTEDFPEARRIASKDEFSAFVAGIEAARAEKQRVAVILPLTFASQVIENNLVQHFNAKVQVPASSLSLTDFARRRENEKQMRIRCEVDVVDKTGLGELGCVIAQAARANYRKRFAIGEPISFIYQVGLRDHIVFYTREN